MIQINKILLNATLALTAFVSVAPALGLGVNYGAFEKGANTFVASEDSFLLSKPDCKEHSKQLHVGDAIQIVEQEKTTETVRKLKDSFYKVKVGADSGYIWGGDLAKAYLRLDESSSPAILLVRIDGITTGDCMGHAAVAEFVQSGKVLSKCRFRAIESAEGDDYRYSLNLFNFPGGFTGAPRLLRLEQKYEACDYSNGDSILIIRGTTVRHAFDARSVVNEQGGMTYKFIGPKDKGGSPDKLTVVYTSGLHESKHKNVTRETYTWNGKFFAPPAKLALDDTRDKPWKDSPENGGAF